MISNIEVSDKLQAVTKYILNSVSEEGSWTTSDYEPWGPVITVLTVDHLLTCGFNINTDWIVSRDNSEYFCSLKKCLVYLNSKITSDGKFGSDFWDTCKMASTINKHKLFDYFDNYNLLTDYIHKSINEGILQQQDYEWCHQQGLTLNRENNSDFYE